MISTLARYLAGPKAEVVGRDPTSRLQINDPVFFKNEFGEWSQVGYVRSRESSVERAAEPDQQVTIAWYPVDPNPSDCELIQYRSSGRLEDVIAVMLPEDQRRKIAARLSEAMSQHGDQLAAAYIPLVQESLKRSMPIIEAEFHASIERHRGEVDQLTSRWNDRVMKQRLIPLARREILPIVRRHGEPQAEIIGRELWDKASIWRFGWRAVYDRSPLPKKDLLQEEWDRFVQEQAVPVFESHMDGVVTAVQNIVADVAANDAVRAELSEVAGEIATDPQTRELVRTILKETMVDNAQLRQVWTDVWTSDEARRAFELTGDRLEPIARQIGDDLFGTQEGGINPNFARVLRNQILGKDRRWIVARRSSAVANETRIIEVGGETMPYPIVYLANDNASNENESP